MAVALHSTTADTVSPPGVSHVFATTDGVGVRAVRLAAFVGPMFLAEAGWDPATRVLSPPPTHPLLGRPVCRVVLDPLAPHARAVAGFADEAGVAEPTASLFSQLGTLLLSKATYTEANPLLRRAQTIDEMNFGQGHLMVAIAVE